MKKEIGLFKISVKESLQYRMHFIIGAITAPITLLVFYFLWKSIFAYSGQEVIKGFTFVMMLNYLVINFIISILTFTYVDQTMSYDIRFGEVVSNLLRPISLLKWYFFGERGNLPFSLFIEAIPVFLISIFFFSLKIYSISALIFFIISLVFAGLISFMISYILGLSSFWLKRIIGLRRLKRGVIAFFGGGLIPLTFFPESFQKISYFLPFQYIRYVPVSIYLENIKGINVLYVLLAQVAWIIGLYFLSIVIYNAAIKKFTGEGT